MQQTTVTPAIQFKCTTEVQVYELASTYFCTASQKQLQQRIKEIILESIFISTLSTTPLATDCNAASTSEKGYLCGTGAVVWSKAI
jgi:hypothetical protein